MCCKHICTQLHPFDGAYIEFCCMSLMSQWVIGMHQACFGEQTNTVKVMCQGHKLAPHLCKQLKWLPSGFALVPWARVAVASTPCSPSQFLTLHVLMLCPHTLNTAISPSFGPPRRQR